MYHAIQVNIVTENHDASGPDTYCQSVLCDENEYVFNKERLACPPGTYNAPGDDASSGTNTTCDAVFVVKIIMYQTINV